MCDQYMVARLNISDILLKEYMKYESSVLMLAVTMRVWYQKPSLSFAMWMVASWYCIMASMIYVNKNINANDKM